jgi:capsid assembly protease
MADRYPHVVQMLTETPWAVLPDTLEAIREMVATRDAGDKFSDEEIAARVAGGAGSKRAYQASGVAILPLYGVLIPRANLMSQMSGGTSLEQWGAALDAAADNPAVSAILIDANSPGGSTGLVPETAAKVRAARAKKRVVAVANTIAASAAYWIIAQADEIVVTPSGSVGSIGVYMSHDDLSGAAEQAGVKRTFISAGRHKVEGHPFEPLSEEARGALQAYVDEFYGMFVRDVARGRRTGAEAVRAGFGEGRMVPARQAVSDGMADSIDTFEAALARLLRSPAPGRAPGATKLGGLPVALDDQPSTDGHVDRNVGTDQQDASTATATLRAFLLQQAVKEAVR